MLQIILMILVSCNLYSTEINLNIDVVNVAATKSILLDVTNPNSIDTVDITLNPKNINKIYQTNSSNLFELIFFYNQEYTLFQSIYFEIDTTDNSFSILKDENTGALSFDNVYSSIYFNELNKFYKDLFNVFVENSNNPQLALDKMYEVFSTFIISNPDKYFGYFFLNKEYESLKIKMAKIKDVLVKYNSIAKEFQYYQLLNDKVKDFDKSTLNEISEYYVYNIIQNKVKINEKLNEEKELIFWASWCQPCLKQIKSLVNSNPNYKNYILISIDSDKDNWLNAIKKFNFDKFENYIDQAEYSGSFRSHFNIKGIPYHIKVKNNKIYSE